MNSKWSTRSLGDAPIQIIDGDRGTNYPGQNDFLPDGHCLFLNTGNVTSNGFNFTKCAFISAEKDSVLRKGKLARGDVVLTTRGTVGNVAIYNSDVSYENLRINSGMVILRPNQDQISSLFLYLFLRSEAFIRQVGFLRSGSAQPQLPIRDLCRVEIPIPSISEQTSICAVLGPLDDRVTLLRKTNATLEAIAQALFKSWFVDFDPVRAKAEGREPEGMSAEITGLFPDSFQSASMGEVPQGWKLITLSDAYEINPPRKLRKGSVAPYLDMAKVGTSGHTAEEAVDRPTGSGSKFINGDTLLARITPCLENGKTAFVDFLLEDQVGWGSTEFVVLRPKSPLPVYHGYLLSRHDAFREHAIQSMSGTSGRQRIQNDVLGRYVVAVPTDAVCDAFDGIVSAIQKTIASNHVQTQTLSALRDTLLPRLISGQLRLPEAEALLRHAA